LKRKSKQQNDEIADKGKHWFFHSRVAMEIHFFLPKKLPCAVCTN